MIQHLGPGGSRSRPANAHRPAQPTLLNSHNMPFTPVESVFGGAALAFTLYWHAHYLPPHRDAPPSLRGLLHAHAPTVAFTTGHISVGILLSRVLPSLFHPLPLPALPLTRLLFATVLLAAGLTLANACAVPHLSPLARASPLPLAAAVATASATATLFASSRFFAPAVPQPLAFPPREHVCLMACALLLCTGLPPLLSGLQARPTPLMQEVLSYALGACTAFALIAANALHPAKLLAFLDVEADAWDASLPLVALSVAVVSASLPAAAAETDVEAAHPALLGPLKREQHAAPACWRAVLGAILAGIGAGLGGIAPHCALIYFGAFPNRLEAVAVVMAILASTAVCSLLLSFLDDRSGALGQGYSFELCAP